MKKISALLAALLLSVSAFAQSGGFTFTTPGQTSPSPAVSASNVVASNGQVIVTTPNGVITLEPASVAGQYKVVASTNKSVPVGSVTKSTPALTTVASSGAVTTAFVFGGVAVFLTSLTTANGTVVTAATSGTTAQ